MTSPSEDQLHPVAQQYLRDLRSSLQYSDPAEAQDTINAVSEHLSEALTPQSSAQEVQAVLDALGPVESIVRESTPASHPTSAQAASTPATPQSALIPMILAVTALVLVVLLPHVGALLSLAALAYSLVILKRSGGSVGSKWAVAVSSIALILVLVVLAGLVV